MEPGKVEIRCLGSLELTVGGEPLPVSGVRQRRLVAALAVHRNRTTGVDALAAAIWPDGLPGDVTGSVQSLVSRLRRTLPRDGGARLVSGPGGYCLSRTAEAGPAAAGPLYREALALWRGPALGELAAEPFAQAEAARLDRLHAEAVEELADCELAAGAPGAAVDLLEPYVREHPLRERARAALVLGLYRLGRQADALAAYRDLRRELDEQLGLEPTAALRDLEQLILRQDPRLEAVMPSPAPPSGGFPLPPVAEVAGRIFVGRGPQLEQCLAAWAGAGKGGREAILVGGEPGIGKTRLAAEVAAHVAAAGGLVLGGRCDEDLGVPYQPFVEALRHYLAYAPEVRTGRHGGDLARLVPDLPARVPGLAAPLRSDPETERYRLFDAVAGWLAAVCADTPVLLVLDDLQWAAKPTLLLLRHVLRSAEPLRLLVLGTYRDTELGRGHPLAELLADLRPAGGTERIALAGLDEPAVLAYLHAAAGQEPAAAGSAAAARAVGLAREVWQETEGNPFFVGEFVRHLTETGALARRGERWDVVRRPAEVGVPEGVRDVVGRRLGRLPESAVAVLAAASVAGLEFDPDEVRRAGNFGEEAVLAALDAAVAARLVAEGPFARPAYRFAHALVRATLYDELTGIRRTVLHRRYGEVLEARLAEDGRGDDPGDRLPALAHHWARAGRSVPAVVRAVDYAGRAGDRALAQLAHDEAVGYYRQALALMGDSAGTLDSGSLATGSPDAGPVDRAGRRRLDLTVRLGEALHRAGDPAHRETLLEAARAAHERGDVDALVRAVLANHRGIVSVVGAIDRERVQALEWAVEAVGPAAGGLRARLLALLAGELHFSGDSRPAALCREAIATARAADDAAALVQVLAVAAYVLWGVVPVPERAGWAAEMAQHAQALGDPMLHFQAAVASYYALCEQPDLAAAEQRFADIRRLADELGQPLLAWRMTYMAGVLASALGRYDEFARLAEETLRVGELTGQPDAFGHSRGPLSMSYLLRGRPQEARAVHAELVAQFPRTTTFHAMLAWSTVESGDHEEGRALVARLRGDGFHTIARDYTFVISLVWLAHAAAQLGEKDWAAELYDLLAASGHRVVVAATTWVGPVDFPLGVLAAALERYADAERHFAAAAALARDAGAAGIGVHIGIAWAAALRRRAAAGDADRAAQLAAHAAAAAVALGHPELERRAKALA